MQTIKLSSKGQLVIPKTIREQHHWLPGTEFIIYETGSGITLEPAIKEKSITIDAVFGCLQHSGKPVSVEDMHDAILAGIKARE